MEGPGRKVPDGRSRTVGSFTISTAALTTTSTPLRRAAAIFYIRVEVKLINSETNSTKYYSPVLQDWRMWWLMATRKRSVRRHRKG